MIDESLFRSLYDRTSKALLSYIIRVCGDAALADDVLQEAYVRFLRSSVNVENEAKMKSYLYRIATNIMNDHFRKKKRERNWMERQTVTSSSVGQTGESGLKHDVEKAFQHLSLQQRSLLWLAYVEGYGHREIAEMLKLKEKSVKVLLFRAKQKMIEISRTMGLTLENIV